MHIFLPSLSKTVDFLHFIGFPREDHCRISTSTIGYVRRQKHDFKEIFPRQTAKLFAMVIRSQCRLVQPATIIFIFALSWPCYADEHQTNSSRSIVQQGIIEIPDYEEATKVAKEKSAMLLVSIRAKNLTNTNDLVTQQLADPSVREVFINSKTPWVFCELNFDKTSITLLHSNSLQQLRKGPGIFVVDYANKAMHGRVISALPRQNGQYYTFQPSDLLLLPALPTGSLTQRSMILAVRRHTDLPKSTDGIFDIELSKAATLHSVHQAQLQKQGHHDWQRRSQQLRLHGGIAKEVCAESWPDQDLLDSCVDCVSCWRQSPGHWRAVYGEQSAFAYDIRQGNNSIWYATGIFIQ